MNKKRKRKLHEIYATIPTIECVGKCTEFCGALGMEKGEYEEMRKAGGKEPAVNNALTCNYLQKGRCSIYDDRPTICRVWGVVDGLPCPHGCKTTRKLAPLEFANLMEKVRKIAGDGKSYKNCPPEVWQKDLSKSRTKNPPGENFGLKLLTAALEKLNKGK